MNAGKKTSQWERGCENCPVKRNLEISEEAGGEARAHGPGDRCTSVREATGERMSVGMRRFVDVLRRSQRDSLVIT